MTVSLHTWRIERMMAMGKRDDVDNNPMKNDLKISIIVPVFNDDF